eukprot:TRINITY_DN66980_c7_g10_i1.p1 TRINITY_DN66980_c7_g10~~TRINITY_DN66980_c7_g10_i1.p1  ORF type:complete len:546 (-),score=48.72 TRINITY_DN66980_c7_g10_i1:126-1763(-)
MTGYPRAEDEYAELVLVEHFRADESIKRCIPLTPIAKQKGGVVRFGRVNHENFADIAICSNKFSSMISRKHASFTLLNGQWTVMDHKSLNGVLVNFKKIEPEKPFPLRDGDVVTFGTDASDLVYTFEVGRRKQQHQRQLQREQEAQREMDNLDRVADQGFYTEKQYQHYKLQLAQRLRPMFHINFDHTPKNTTQIPGFSVQEWKQAQTEHVIKYTYKFQTKTWHKAVAIITMDTTPFDKGAMRVCYKLRDWTQATGTQDFVAKHAIAENEPQVTYFVDAEMQAFCAWCANEFNKKNPPKTVSFVEATVFECFERQKSPVFACEPYMRGKYVKHSNNYGFVSPEDRNTPQAFSHFTYNITQQSCLVCDIQGVDDLYTDPQVHSKDQRGFGKGNMGRDGITRFFRSHKCNAICDHLGIALEARKDYGDGTAPPMARIKSAAPPVSLPAPASRDPFIVSDMELMATGLKSQQLNEIAGAFKKASNNGPDIEKIKIVPLCDELGLDVQPQHLGVLCDMCEKGKTTIHFRVFLEWLSHLFVSKANRPGGL